MTTTNFIQAEQGNINPAAQTIRTSTDVAVAPPFEALDRLNNVTTRLDGDLSTLIGQLAPYCLDRLTSELRDGVPTSADRSSLENRIEHEIAALLELAVRVEELLGSLRL